MITITLLNMKGGVGKTTLAVNLAWNISREGARVLLVDLDPQFNASQSMMTYDEWEEHRKAHGTIADILLDAERSRMPWGTKVKGTQPLMKRLYTVETDQKTKRSLSLLPSELGLALAIKNPMGVEYKLEKALKTVEKEFDYVLIDSSPTNTVLAPTALMASDFVLVPMRPDRFSILGYELVENVLDDFRSVYPDPHGVRSLGVVFTFVSKNPGKIERECKAKVKEAAADSYVFSSELAVSNSYLRAAYETQPISDTQYARKATKESMQRVTKELKERIAALRGPVPGAKK